MMSTPKHKKQALKECRVVSKLMIDLNPSTSRLGTSISDDMGEISPCILPNSCLWLHLPTPRLMLGWEAMLFQGWPISQVTIPPTSGVTNQLLQDLAGNGVALPVLLALLLSTCVAVSWADAEAKACETPTTDQDVADALQMLQQLQ